MKSNIHKKQAREDKFGRKFFCQRAARNLVRFEKRQNKRKTRRIMKLYVKKEATYES